MPSPQRLGHSTRAPRASSAGRVRPTSASRAWNSSTKPDWDPSTRVAYRADDPLYAMLEEHLERRGFQDDFDAAYARYLLKCERAAAKAIAAKEHRENAAVWYYCTYELPAVHREKIEEEEKEGRMDLVQNEARLRWKLEHLLRESTEALAEELWIREQTRLAREAREAEEREQWERECLERLLTALLRLQEVEEAERLDICDDEHDTFCMLHDDEMLRREELEELLLERGRMFVEALITLEQRELSARRAIERTSHDARRALLDACKAEGAARLAALRQATDISEERCREDLEAAEHDARRGIMRAAAAAQLCQARMESIASDETHERGFVQDQWFLGIEALFAHFQSDSRQAHSVLDSNARGVLEEEEAAAWTTTVVYSAQRSILFVLWSQRAAACRATEDDEFASLLAAADEDRALRRVVHLTRAIAADEQSSRPTAVRDEARERLLLEEAEARSRTGISIYMAMRTHYADVVLDIAVELGTVQRLTWAAMMETFTRETAKASIDLHEAREGGARQSIWDAEAAARSHLEALHDLANEEHAMRCEERHEEQLGWCDVRTQHVAYLLAYVPRIEEPRARDKIAASRDDLVRKLKSDHAERVENILWEAEAAKRRQRDLLYKKGLQSPKKFIGVTAVERLRDRVLQVDALYVDGPAHSAGIQLGDVIVSLGGAAVATRDQMRRALAQHGKVGATVELHIKRPPPSEEGEPGSPGTSSMDSSSVSQPSSFGSFSGAPRQSSTSRRASIKYEEMRFSVEVKTTDGEFGEFDYYFNATAADKIGNIAAG